MPALIASDVWANNAEPVPTWKIVVTECDSVLNLIDHNHTARDVAAKLKTFERLVKQYDASDEIKASLVVVYALGLRYVDDERRSKQTIADACGQDHGLQSKFPTHFRYYYTALTLPSSSARLATFREAMLTLRTVAAATGDPVGCAIGTLKARIACDKVTDADVRVLRATIAEHPNALSGEDANQAEAAAIETILKRAVRSVQEAVGISFSDADSGRSILAGMKDAMDALQLALELYPDAPTCGEARQVLAAAQAEYVTKEKLQGKLIVRRAVDARKARLAAQEAERIRREEQAAIQRALEAKEAARMKALAEEQAEKARRASQGQAIESAMARAREEKLCDPAVAILQDALRKNPDAPNRAEAEAMKAQLEERIRVFNENTAKGLVEHDGQWMKPSQIAVFEENKRRQARATERLRQENVYEAEADRLVMSKYRFMVSLQVAQAIPPHGALCKVTEQTPYGKRYTGELLYLTDESLIFVDGEWTTTELYWAGTYTYTTVQDALKTVNHFVRDRAGARQLMRAERDMYFQDTGEDQGLFASTPDDDPQANANSEPKSCGSGFLVTQDGYLITNGHVIEDASRVLVITAKGQYDAKLIEVDKDNDIALLKINGSFDAVSFSQDMTAKLGQTVFTVGFPVPQLQGFSPKVTRGVISSMKGGRDDVRLYQVDASVQPGNSGGPLADEYGNVIGIVSSRLNDVGVLLAAGFVPQNVNYAIKKSYVMALINGHPKLASRVSVKGSPRINLFASSFEDAVDEVQKATVQLVVY